MSNSPVDMESLKTIFFKLVVPFLGALCLTLFKVASDNRIPKLEDTNDIALDLVATSLVAMAAVRPSKGEDVYTAIVTMNLLAMGFLLLLRGIGRRQRARRARLVKAKAAPLPTDPAIWRSFAEVFVGCIAAAATVGFH